MPERKFTMALTPGSIGVQADQRRAVELAHYFGFESVEAYARELAALSDAELKDLREEMEAKHVAWAMAGLPVDFRRDEQSFREGMQELPGACRALQRAGVTRLTTWLMPMHESLTYLQNFKQTAGRLREIDDRRGRPWPALRPRIRGNQEPAHAPDVPVRSHHGRDQRADRRDRQAQRRLRARYLALVDRRRDRG